MDNSKELSRRSFLGLGATAALAAGAAGTGFIGCTSRESSGKTTKNNSGATNGEPSFMETPTVPNDIKETKECEVLVLGLGISGVTASRQASEAGAKVIGIEKQAQVGTIALSGDFGIYGSKIQEQLGMELADKEEVINQLMKDMTFRSNAAMLSYWYDHSGEDFDWFIEGSTYEVVPTTATPPSSPEANYIRPKYYPVLEGYDRSKEIYPFFNGSLTTLPSVGWCVDTSKLIAEANGAEFIFGTFAEQLIKDESGRVTGAYVYNADGVYTQINASKGVILCCGDLSGNEEMLLHYVPWIEGVSSFYPNIDVKGKVANSGDGHRMGMWAGGHMETGPLAPMTHHMGGALGVNAYLQLNAHGERFMNEDIPGQNIQNQLLRQPEMRSVQIIDSKWPEQLSVQGTGHGYVNYYIPDSEAEKWPAVVGDEITANFSGYTTDKMFLDAVDYQADTIEELAEKMGLPIDTVVASIGRYNELCHKGVDEDFGKPAKRMFPIENPPYYACDFGDAGMLVCMGGLDCDVDCHVLDDNMLPIPGLYVAGNTMGGRYAVEYPVTEAGLSLSTAMTFGRLAGAKAAAGE